jgi:glucoamylase
VRIAAAALVCAVVVLVGAVLVSGGSDSDPRTPAALPGLPPPFLGTTVTGDGGMTAAVDAYGDVVDLRAPGPAGAPLIDNPSARQAAGTVPADTGIVPRVRIGGESLPMWQAEAVTQSYLPGTNVVRTFARFGRARVVMTTAASGESLALTMDASGGTPSVSINVEGGVRCASERRAAQLDLNCQLGRVVAPVLADAERVRRAAVKDGRRWVGASKALGPAAPRWARGVYERSLLTIHALTSRRTGAVAAGARDGWAYVWPRDAATAALALEASGHGIEARAVTKFLTALDLNAAARFTESGAPVPGRAAQGDAAGWVIAAATATNLEPPQGPFPWRDRADYQESSPGTYLGNALAATGTLRSATPVDGPKTQAGVEFSARQRGGQAEARRIAHEFGTERGLVRVAGGPASGLDSAAGWAVRPFGLRPLYPAAERTLLHLVEAGTPYGITPGEGWQGGEDPWMAPTAWSAWSLAALAEEPSPTATRTGARGPRTNLPAVRERGVPSRPSPRNDEQRSADRQAALELLADLRRASTPAGDLPERVGAKTGIPTSTTPLLWPSAFAVLALRELWP